jgi:uncharacterized membrane protein YbhN (UPF0104 family)
MLKFRTVPPRLRVVLGVLVSLVLLALVLTRVDPISVGQALARADPTFILLAVLGSVLDQTIRAGRWRLILRPIQVVPIGAAFAFQSVGYLGNAALPARLGDLARAHLAGRAFEIPRLTTLGSIVAERVLDGTAMLVLAGISSLLVVRADSVRGLVGYAIAIGILGLGSLTVGWLVLTRLHQGRTSKVGLIREFGLRVGVGWSAFRNPMMAASIIVVTLIAELVGAAIVFVATRSVGINLSPLEAVLLISSLALSLAIPAAPGGWGTYEFAGLTVLSVLGHDPDASLAAILIARAATTIPAVVFGLVSLTVLGIRPSSILHVEAEIE